jgi:hypothetical protein
MGSWLVKRCEILGVIPFQNWMLLAAVILALGMFLSWWAQKRCRSPRTSPRPPPG